jgi:hypothetical protein
MIDINHCTITIALAHARKAVKEEVWAKGGKPNLVPLSVIQRMAKDYLIGHPELIAEARPVAEEMHRQHQAKLAYQRQRRANIRNDAPKSEPCSASTIPVQMLGSK